MATDPSPAAMRAAEKLRVEALNSQSMGSVRLWGVARQMQVFANEVVEVDRLLSDALQPDLRSEAERIASAVAEENRACKRIAMDAETEFDHKRRHVRPGQAAFEIGRKIHAHGEDRK